MQTSPRHGITEKEERTLFIKENWKNMSDIAMARNLMLSVQAVCAYRCWLGLYRQKHNTLLLEKKVMMAEMYFTEYNLKNIVQVTGHTYYTVSKFITDNMLFKRLSDDTKVITLQSKV